MSIFKRLFGEKDDNYNNSNHGFRPPLNNSNIKHIGSNLQKRFSRGVQYNMKIVIRGDRNVGKSALLNRLKGLEFCEQYIPTEEIEVACIHWNYKSNDDVVKVEVWDVVDKGRKKKQSGLKFENTNGPVTEDGSAQSICLDAEFLDVYKGAHAVIMVLDITKSWTLNYVERELQCVPKEIPVLVLSNHRDMGVHRTVTADQVQSLVESTPHFERRSIKCWESSMKNGYGLMYIHRFFNIPFLQLQRDTLLKLLATNEREMDSALQELEDMEEEPDNSYDNFISNLKHSKMSATNACSNFQPMHKPTSLAIPNNSVVGVSQISSPSTTVTPSGSNIIPTPTGSMNSITIGGTVLSNNKIHVAPQARPIPGMEKLGLYPTVVSLPMENNLKQVLPNGSEVYPSNSTSTSVSEITPNHQLGLKDTKDNCNINTLRSNIDRKNIDEFVPDEHPELSSFLDELPQSSSTNKVELNHQDWGRPNHNDEIDSSSDEYMDGKSTKHYSYSGRYGDHNDSQNENRRKGQNPMVTSFRDEIDIDDVIIVDHVTALHQFNNDSASSDADGEGMGCSTIATTATRAHIITQNSLKTNVVNQSKTSALSTESTSQVKTVDIIGLLNVHNDVINLPTNISTIDVFDQQALQIKNDPDTDEATLNSNNSSSKKKKKKHHHHHNKDNSGDNKNKELSSKKKKRKSKVRSPSGGSPSPDESMTKTTKNVQRSLKTTSKTITKPDATDRHDNTLSHQNNNVAESSFRCDRSDSLERFLND